MNDRLTAPCPYTVALHGAPDLCAPIQNAFAHGGQFAAADILQTHSAAELLAQVRRQPGIGAVILVWSAAELAGLVRQTAEVRRHLADPLTPIFVRSTTPLTPGVRSELRALGIYGPYCREGVNVPVLVEDVLHAIDSAHERRALVAISAFAGNKDAKSSLIELATMTLKFLGENGIGTAGGLFCFLRPTSAPAWVVMAGSGQFQSMQGLPATRLAPQIRTLIEDDATGPAELDDETSLTLRLVTAEGCRVCLYLTQDAPLVAWHRIVAGIFRNRLAVVVDEVMQKRRIERAQHAGIATLATVSEYRDVDTGNHVARVSRIATTVTQILFDRGLVGDGNVELIRHIGHASILHDIGKVGIPDAILLKNGPLDAEERRIMQTHAALGHEILSKTAMTSDWPTLMTLAASIARSHHERYDGTGYPDGLAGTDIPLAARIVAVVDVFDALVGERPYKQPWTEAEALAYLSQQSGRHFDPQVVAAFLVAVQDSQDRVVVEWSAPFSVGHEAIDRDHQRLFAILNQIWQDKQAGNRLVLETALDELMHYTCSHFAREEEYMIDFGYPGYAAHREAHQSFAAQIESLRWEYLHGLRKNIHDDLLDHLWHWLMDHIVEADKRFSHFIAGLGSCPDAADAQAPAAT